MTCHGMPHTPSHPKSAANRPFPNMLKQEFLQIRTDLDTHDCSIIYHAGALDRICTALFVERSNGLKRDCFRCVFLKRRNTQTTNRKYAVYSI